MVQSEARSMINVLEGTVRTVCVQKVEENRVKWKG